MAARTPLIDFIVKNQSFLTQVDLVRELWMVPDRMVATYDTAKLGDQNAFWIETDSPLYRGKLFVFKDHFYSVEEFARVDDRLSDAKHYHVTAHATGIGYDPKEKTPLCSPQDTFILQPGEIANYTATTATETTIGIFVANYLFLVYPFGAEIPYINDTFTASKLQKQIALRLLDNRISVQAVKDKYINTLMLFGQSNEIICPGISEKTITIPKAIADLRERLVAENRLALEAGDASVMSDIERQLIAAYKKHLEGDPSLHFLLKPKYFNVTLKKLFLTQGMTEVFGSPGKFTFVDNPMGDGWKQKDLAVIFNEVRSGSYSRAIETADGGVIAKLILRVLQDTRINIEDCGTHQGGHVHATADTLKDFIWNYVVNADNTSTVITDENTSTFVGQNLVIRTPGYCKASQGFCAKCFGYLFEKLGQKAFAPVANDFARVQTTNALKMMHGKSHNVVDVSDISRYLIG